MKKVMIIGCGAYMDGGYGCPGEWRCLKAATHGDGKFDEPVLPVAFLRCECPGRPIMANIKMTMKLSDIKPDAIHFASCMANAQPGCPYHGDMQELANKISKNFDVPVVLGTHNY